VSHHNVKMRSVRLIAVSTDQFFVNVTPYVGSLEQGCLVLVARILADLLCILTPYVGGIDMVYWS
jgi:hypothetical protein